MRGSVDMRSTLLRQSEAIGMTAPGSPKHSFRTKLRSWFQEPSTWLSLSSLLVSGITFLYVNYYADTVTIYMPKQIAFSAPPGLPLEFVVGASLLNDAPPNNVKIVEDARLEVSITAGGSAFEQLRCNWTETRDLIPTLDFERLYGKLNDKAKMFTDQFGPPRRRTPFTIHGKELQSPSLVFNCLKPMATAPSVANTSDSRRVETVIVLMTANKTSTSEKRAYTLPRDVEASTNDGSYNWIDRLEF
jgi:hypothetical protein